ncbi:hypothetical protein GCM10018772_55960 [Streptomyces fumanus]|uniref:Uncharacterized protein n=1 Tax=Streptomyces fumanus TaxID=67302 RepID=A0A919AR81_9ACTN|nr:hypothetical protein GCM10018772_55960 [Streptomyces fumanus]
MVRTRALVNRTGRPACPGEVISSKAAAFHCASSVTGAVIVGSFTSSAAPIGCRSPPSPRAANATRPGITWVSGTQAPPGAGVAAGLLTGQGSR